MTSWPSLWRGATALTGALSMFSMCAPQAAAQASKEGTKVHVIETSLGLTNQVRLLRHLALRFGDEDDFVEAHFGPGTHGEGREGFLDTGKGAIADQEYLAVIDAGETVLSKDDAISWCKEWAKGKLYLSVGQNCWTMVHDFLETHDGCQINDELKFKEQQINHSSQMLVHSIEYLADQQGRKTDDVMEDFMQDPSKLMPVLFSAENMKHFMPNNVSDATRKGYQMASGMTQQDWSSFVEGLGMRGMKQRMDEVAGEAHGAAQEQEQRNKEREERGDL